MQRIMIVSRMWSWVCLKIALIICLTLKVVSEPNTAALVGIVYCDTCYNRDFSKSSHFIAGASVVVECGGVGVGVGVGVSGKESSYREEVKTNLKGEFTAKLPFAVTDRIRECSIKLIRSNEPDCPVVAPSTETPIKLKAKTPGNLIFSAGVFTFRPRKQPRQCQTRTRNKNSDNGIRAAAPFPSPNGKETTMEYDDLVEPNAFGLPLPYQFQQPSPVPLFPFQPPSSVPMFPFQAFQPPPDTMFVPDPQPPPETMFTPDFQPPSDSIFTPDFQPPPDSMFDPVPLQPPPDSMYDQFQPSPSTFTSQFLTPPPPPLFFSSLPFPPLQPLPNLIQSPPPPSLPQPALLPPFPPFPFQPSQGMPGTPPGISSVHLKKTTSP